MSSENRSSSAVRNLRSLFENKHGDNTSSEPRGRSPAGSLGAADSENGGLRRTSKVRASFVSVEPKPSMATLQPQPSESNAGRRGSFGEADGDLELKKSISNSQGTPGPSTAVSSVEATPTLKPQVGQLGQVPGDKEAENPDKHLTGEEEEPLDMKPADLASSEAVSGGQALPPVAEDLRKSTNQVTAAAKTAGTKPTVNGTSKPAAISTKAPSKPATSSVKSPASAKTPTSATSTSKPAKTESPKAQPAKAPLKKPSRSSLTAPTAASMARSGPGEKSSNAAASKTKPRETTKPVSLPSHLTAPTASSRAKHEAEPPSKPATSNLRASTTSKPKPTTATTKPTRSSLAPEHRSTSRTSQTSHTRRSVAPADGSFLERMMKPTAASANKTHEKTDVKSPPRQKGAAPLSKPKTNGTAVKEAKEAVKDTAKKVVGKRTSGGSERSAKVAVGREVGAEEPPQDDAKVVEPAVAESASGPVASESSTSTSAPVETTPHPTANGQEPVPEAPKASEASAGNETPQAAGETAMGSAGLEATPAGLGSEEAIR